MFTSVYIRVTRANGESPCDRDNSTIHVSRWRFRSNPLVVTNLVIYGGINTHRAMYRSNTYSRIVRCKMCNVTWSNVPRGVARRTPVSIDKLRYRQRTIREKIADTLRIIGRSSSIFRGFSPSVSLSR